MKNGFLQHLKPSQKLSYYIVFVILGWFFAQLFSVFLSIYVFEIDIENFDFNDYTKIEVIRLTKILNFISHLFMFIVPAVIFAKMIAFDPKEVFLAKKIEKRFWLSIPFLFIFLTVANGLLYILNHKIDFSFISQEFQDSLIYSQALKDKAIYAYIGSTWKSYFVNIFLIAIVPAVGEELTFRGLIPHLFAKVTGKIYLSVLLAALMFALIHAQPFNIIPIFALGVAYGFIAIYFGSIWATMILHFANNALQISMMHLARIYGWENYTSPIYYDLIALGVSMAVLGFLYAKNKDKFKLNEVKGIYLR